MLPESRPRSPNKPVFEAMDCAVNWALYEEDSSPKVPDEAVYAPVSEALVVVVVGAMGESVSAQDVVYWTVYGPLYRVVREAVGQAVIRAVREEVVGSVVNPVQG